MNSPLEVRHQLAIVSSKVTESLLLLLKFLFKDLDDVVSRFATFKLVGKLGQIGPRSILEFFHGLIDGR